PSPTRPPSGVVIHARTWASWPPSGGRSANAWTGSPSVVAYRKYSDRLPVSNQPWPNASSSSGGELAPWVVAGPPPPRDPQGGRVVVDAALHVGGGVARPANRADDDVALSGHDLHLRRAGQSSL